MLAQELNDKLISAIREKLPPGANIANRLMDMLCIGREAVYRRLRGEVPFTLSEAALICHKMNISLDSIAGGDTGFAVVDVHFVKNQESLSAYRDTLGYFLHSYTKLGNDPAAQLHAACNSLPFMIYLGFDNLSKFILFKWLYQRGALAPGVTYGDFELPTDLLKLHRQYVAAARNINHGSCLFDYQIFEYLIGDLRYFSNIGLLSRDNIEALKGDFRAMLDELEGIAVKGRFSNGREFHLYVSSVNFDSTYCIVSGESSRLAFLKICGANMVSSTEMKLFEQLRVWIESLRKFSTLISQSGEMQRVMFFNRQRSLVENL